MPNKKHFVLKLLPSRSTFAQDMNAEERAIMQQHVIYWTGLLNRGTALLFGPVLDPNGAYGLGIVVVESEDEVRVLIENDPAGRIGRYEFYPMKAITPDNK